MSDVWLKLKAHFFSSSESVSKKELLQWLREAPEIKRNTSLKKQKTAECLGEQLDSGRCDGCDVIFFCVLVGFGGKCGRFHEGRVVFGTSVNFA